MQEVELVELIDEKNEKIYIFLVPISFSDWIKNIKKEFNNKDSWVETMPENVKQDLDKMCFTVKYKDVICGGDNFRNDIYLSIIDNAPNLLTTKAKNYDEAEQLHEDVYYQVINNKLNIVRKYSGKYYAI